MTAGYKAGFQPVFAMKHVLMQFQPMHGLNDWRLSSCNLHGKSWVSLEGFTKQYAQDVHKCVVMGVLYDGKVLSSKEQVADVEA